MKKVAISMNKDKIWFLSHNIQKSVPDRVGLICQRQNLKHLVINVGK